MRSARFSGSDPRPCALRSRARWPGSERWWRSMMTDRQLLESLRRTLVTADAPPEHRVEHLRSLVLEFQAAPQTATATTAAASASRAPRRIWANFRRAVAVPIIAVAALVGTTGVAFALGPRTQIGATVRNMAHDVGLPVESARVVNVRD